MSLILDALKKSEAERQRGQVPNLLSPLPSAIGSTQSQKKHRWPMLALVLLLVVSLLLGLSFAAYFYMKTVAATSPSITHAPINKTPMQAEPTEAIKIVAPSPTISATKPMPIEKPAAPRTPVAAIVEPLPAPPPLKPQAHDTAPLFIQTEPVALIAGLSEMPNEQRQQLPALKLSMHVYSAEASKRFAIIDGQRVNEGSVMGAAVVEQIRQDGVVLSVQGQSYLLPRP
jgi:general secretion pathway protein B